MKGVDSEKVLSYFLRNGFLNRREQDIENAVFITKNLLKIRGYPFAYNDFEGRGPSGVNSNEIRKILCLRYENKDRLLDKTSKKVYLEDERKIVQTAEQLAKFDSDKLGLTAQYLFDRAIGNSGKTHLYEWEANIAKNTLNVIESDLEPLIHPENEPKK